MAVKPYIWGKNREKDDFMLKTIQEGRRQYGDKFDSVMESRFWIKKSDYMGESYDKLVSTAQTGGKQAVDNLYKTNTSAITGSQSRNPITAKTSVQPKNILPWTTLGNYGDRGGARNIARNTQSWDNNVAYTKTTFSDIAKSGSAFLYGKKASDKESTLPGYLHARNNHIASALYNSKKSTEQDIWQYLRQQEGFNEADQNDQENTVRAIWNRVGEMRRQDENILNKANNQLDSGLTKTNTDLNHAGYSKYGDSNLMRAIEDKLRVMYPQFKNLEEFEKAFPEEFQTLLQQAHSVDGIYDTYTPEQREAVSSQIEQWLEAAQTTGSSKTQMGNLMDATLSIFDEDSQRAISDDLNKIRQMEARGLTMEQMANELWTDIKKIQALVRVSNGDNTVDLSPWYHFNEEETARRSEAYEMNKRHAKENMDIAHQRADEDLQYLKRQYEENYKRQERQNSINRHNLLMLMGMNGTGYTSTGIEGYQLLQQQSKEVLDDMTDNYNQSSLKVKRYKEDLLRAFEQNDEENARQLRESIREAKNQFVARFGEIQAKYGAVSVNGAKMIWEITANFIATAQKVYNDAQSNARENFKSLVDGQSKLKQLEIQELQLQEGRKNYFMQNLFNMTGDQAIAYASNNWFADQLDQLGNLQVQSAMQYLDQYAPWTGIQYQEQLAGYINAGLSPAMAVSRVINSSGFAPVNLKSGTSSASNKIQSFKEGEYLYDSNGRYLGRVGGESTISQSTDLASGLENFIAQNPVGSKGWECWTFMKEYLWWTSFPSKIWEKIAKITSTEAQIGSVAVIDWSKSETATEKQKTCWHVWIVVSVNDDGTTTLFDSNGKSDYTVGYTKVPTHRIVGYIIPEQNKWVYNQRFDHYFNMISFPNAKMSSNSKSELQSIIKNGWSEEQIRNKFMSIVEKTMGVDAGGKLKSRRDLWKNLNSIKKLLTQLEKEWVKPWFLNGKIEKLANKIWRTANSKIKSLATSLQNELDALMRSRTWAAINASEEKFYNRLFPNEWKSLKLNMADIDGLLYSNTYQIQNSFANIFDEEFAQWLYPSQQKKIWLL